MLVWMAGALIIFQMLTVFDTNPVAEDTVPIYFGSPTAIQYQPGQVVPQQTFKNRGVVKQQYDYSCGSAALTTILQSYLKYPIDEVQTINALLLFGNSEKIIQRRKFSLLDMKKMLLVLGFKSGGYRGDYGDLTELDHPAIIPIEYGGFEHFVVLKKATRSRVYLADPALGNLSMTVSQFQKTWKDSVLFIVFPRGAHTGNELLVLRDKDLSFVDYDHVDQSTLRQLPAFQTFLEKSADIAADRYQFYRP